MPDQPTFAGLTLEELEKLFTWAAERPDIHTDAKAVLELIAHCKRETLRADVAETRLELLRKAAQGEYKP